MKLLVLLLTGWAASPALAEEDAAKSPVEARLLVLDLESNGADEKLVVMLTEEVVAAARDSGKWVVLSAAEVRELLGVEAQRQLLGCEAIECAVDVAGALDAREVLTGLVTRVDRTTQVRIRLLETDAGRVAGSTSVSSRSTEELRDLVRRATFELAEVQFRPRTEREIAWPQREISFTGGIRPPDTVVDTGMGFGLGYQQRLGKISVGPSLWVGAGRASVRWDDLIEAHDDTVRVVSARLGAAARWPSTGGNLLRAYLTTELGLVVGRAVSIAEDRPEWVAGGYESSYGVYAMPGLGLRLLPRAGLGFALEANWVVVVGGLRIADRGIPFDGAPAPSYNERRADLSGFLVTGVLRYGF